MKIERLTTPWWALRAGLGAAAFLAGLDKFFNLLADWGSYVSPLAAAALPLTVPTFMAVVGLIEIAVGVTILVIAPRIGAYIASAWLLLIALNLVASGHLDVAVRDVVMSIAAFTLARALEARASERAPQLYTGPVIAPGA
jgi:cation transport ATPase